MKILYDSPEINIININSELILTASVVVGGDSQPGDEVIDGSDIFG